MNSTTHESEKQCSSCSKNLKVNSDNFHRWKRSKDGFRSCCKDCRKKKEPYDPDKYKNYYEKNKERLQERKKPYYRKYYRENKEYKSEYHKRYRELNKEELRAKKKKYYEENKEQVLRRTKEYFQNNKTRMLAKRNERERWRLRNDPEYKKKRRETARRHYVKHIEKHRLRNSLHRAKKRNEKDLISLAQWERCVEAFDNKCAYCGQHTERLEKEHFVPFSAGGEMTLNNIVPSCKRCNTKKRDKDFFEWYKEQEFYSLERERRVLNYLQYDENNNQQLALL